MTKFNVGDSLEFIEKYGSYEVGDKVTLTFYTDDTLVGFEGKYGNGCALETRFKLSDKPTKNQRITTLENEVAELKLIVHELRGKKSIEPSTTIVEDKPKMTRLVDGQWQPTSYEEIAEMMSLTPNQQRAAIIEKVKKFVEEKLDGQGHEVPDSRSLSYGPWYIRDFDFVVNAEKRTIVALCKGSNGKVRERGIAKCNPNDVFNEHIGKAIALGRALGLDVSEFEQAVQPNEVVVGQIVDFHSRWNGRLLDSFEVAKVEKQSGKILAFKNKNKANYFEFEPDETGDKIINDTNAKYEEG